MKAFRTRLFRIINILILLDSNRKAFKSKSFIVLPHLGYGDMLCCVPMFRDVVRRGFSIQVFSPSHAIPLLKQLLQGHDIIFLPVEDYLSEKEFGSQMLIHRALKFGKRNDIPILFLGQDLWWLHSRIRPDIDIGTFFYRMGRTPLSVFKTFQISEVLRRNNRQHAIPEIPYVLVDHFPGSHREISKQILDDIHSAGFTVVYNPRELKYENLIDLIENASELHLVNSSLLCYALLLNPKAELKMVYLMTSRLYPGLHFYDHEWQEKALHSIGWEKYKSPLKLDRRSEHQNLIRLSKKKRFRLIDFLIFRNYPSPIEN